jgi:hypothetical protein
VDQQQQGQQQGSSGADSSSASLVEALACVRVSSAAGVTKVVLTVPDESPPLDRQLRECWPQGWGPTESAAAAGDTGAPAAAEAATKTPAAAGMAAVPLVGGVESVQSQLRGSLAALAHAGRGSDRVVLGEAEKSQLLGVPYREPCERCC